MANIMENKHPQDLVNLVLAVLLFLSPWVLGYSTLQPAAWNAWISAVVIAVIAIGALSVFREWEEWLNLIAGVWVVIAPWVLGFAAATNAMWTHVVLGLLVAAAAAWEIWEVRHQPHAAA
jgi:SPW repeat